MEEQQVKANGKGELMRNYESSIDAGKHASAHHINMAVEGDRFRDSVTAHTQSFKCTRKLIGSWTKHSFSHHTEACLIFMFLVPRISFVQVLL